MNNVNSTLQDLVMAELRWDPSIDAANLGVTAHDGAITLSGHVPSFPEAVAAEKAVKRVRGVVAVASELEVHLPTSWHRDDTDIAETLARSLADSISVPVGSVKATVKQGAGNPRGDGRVVVSEGSRGAHCAPHRGGHADHQQDHDQGRRVGPRCRGGHPRRLAPARQPRRERCPRCRQGNVATLTGTVSSLAEDRAVWWAASAAPGIERVVDQLTVRSAPIPAGSVHSH